MVRLRMCVDVEIGSPWVFCQLMYLMKESNCVIIEPIGAIIKLVHKEPHEVTMRYRAVELVIRKLVISAHRVLTLSTSCARTGAQRVH